MVSRTKSQLDKMPVPWLRLLGDDFGQALVGIENEISRQVSKGITVLPPGDNRYAAFHRLKPGDVRVVILGQDPYPERDQANGFAFAFDGEPGCYPYSLRRIREKLNRERSPSREGIDLKVWQEHGVLLLNAALSVPLGEPGKHLALWRPATRLVLSKLSLSQHSPRPVIVLWGSKAHRFVEPLETDQARVLRARHPRVWLRDDKPFKDINDRLATLEMCPVPWENALINEPN
jgi:uracil-DNA glycosylase